MVDLWKRTEAETVALLANLPEATVARKATYHNVANGYLTGLSVHTRAHIGEIRALLASAREALETA